MLLNLTNHPLAQWPDSQRAEAAARWGEICDFPFPQVDPAWTGEEVASQARHLVGRALALWPDAVLCQGEMTMTYALTALFQRAGVTVVAACTRRRTEERRGADGSVTKTAVFLFEGFRAYPVF